MDLLIATNSVPLANADTAPVSGTPQYATDGNPETNVPPTLWPAYAFNGLLQELVVSLIGGAGITPSTTNNTQIAQAIKRLAGGNVTAITASTILTADNAGLVLVSAAAGNITITLPLAASAGGAPLPFRFIRTDTSANTVTYAFSGEDTELPTASVTGSIGVGGEIDLIGDGVSHWWKPGNGRLLNVQYFLTPGVFAYTPTPGTKRVLVEVLGGGGASGGPPATGSAQTSAGGGGGAGAYARKMITSGFSGATITVGAAGTRSAGAPGGNGGASSFGAFVSANGGGGGLTAGPTSTTGVFSAAAGLGGLAGTSGDLNIAGSSGNAATVLDTEGVPLPATPSILGSSYGFGGLPTSSPPNTAAVIGNPGGGGLVIVTEYS
jgi:hypothetical protein